MGLFTTIVDPETGLKVQIKLMEAWVPVVVVTPGVDTKVNTIFAQLEPFMGEWGILTYPNSD